MYDFFDSVIFAYEEVAKPYLMRFIVAVGFGVFLFWGVLGYFFWDDIIALSSHLIEMVPFSFIRENSATFASGFIYMQLVLLTFAFFYMFVVNLYMQRLKDTFSGLVSLTLVFGSAAFWGFVWFEKSAFIHEKLEKLFTWLPFETVEMTLAYLLGIYFIYNLIIVSMTLCASLLSRKYLYKVKEENFPYDTIYDNNEKIFLYTLRDIGIYLVASLLVFPLLFVPVLNILSQIFLWIWLAKDTLFYDSATMLYNEVTKEQKKEHQKAIWGIALLGSLFIFIPVVNIFGPFFSEVAMFHYLKTKRDTIYE